MFHAGQQIGVYALIEKLGRGGFGEVWLAEKRSQFITKKVAVKLPHEDQVNPEAIRQEAMLWEQASGHPNVLPIIDADVYDGQVVIVSEYASGGSLADKLKKEGKLPLQRAIELTVGVLNGLEFLHQKQIIHRDIKPQNILLQGDTPRLADFGISRAMQTTAVSSAVIGTDAYMSPEAFDGKRSVQTDIWSVGVLLYVLLAEKLPFPQEHPSERLFAILTKEFAPLPPDMPQNLQKIVNRALAKLPENRYQTAGEMREELRKVLTFLEHPTFAPTEVFRFPAEHQTESVPPDFDPSEEIQTVVGKTTRSQPAYPNSYKPADSVETNLKTAPAEETQPAATIPATAPNAPRKFDVVGKPLAQKKDLNSYKILLLGFGLFLLIPMFAVSFKNCSSNSNYDSTHLEPFKDSTNKYGFKSSSGRTVIEPKYEDAGYFFEGLAAVKLNGKYGYVDEKGQEIIPFKFDEAKSFSDSTELAIVRLNGKAGFIDKKGTAVIPSIYEDVYDFKEGLAAAKSSGKWGFIDRTGNTVIPFKYESGGFFYEGLADVRLSGKEGFIDKTGKEIIPFKYSEAESFISGIATVCDGNYTTRKCGLIDKTGREILPFKYYSIEKFYEELTAVRQSLDGKCGYIDKTGTEVTPLKYTSCGSFTIGYAIVSLDGKTLYIDKSGTESTTVPKKASNTNSR